MAVSEAQKRATAKYEKERYDKILTRFPKGTKDKILETGAQSVNRFIIEAVNEKLERLARPEPDMVEEPFYEQVKEEQQLSFSFEDEPFMEMEAEEVKKAAPRWSRLPMTDQQIEDCARAIKRGEIPFYFIDQVHMRNEMGEENFSRVYKVVSSRKF